MDVVKEVIVFLKEAAQFWKLLTDASKHGVSRTDLFKIVVDKGKEKEDLTILNHSWTQRVAAWNIHRSLGVCGGHD